MRAIHNTRGGRAVSRHIVYAEFSIIASDFSLYSARCSGLLDSSNSSFYVAECEYSFFYVVFLLELALLVVGTTACATRTGNLTTLLLNICFITAQLLALSSLNTSRSFFSCTRVLNKIGAYVLFISLMIQNCVCGDFLRSVVPDSRISQ